MPTPTDNKTLYDRDYALWLDSQVRALKSHNYQALDLENLIEEIEDMGRNNKNALRSYLTRLLEHLLKLHYWETERDWNRNGWIEEINTFRDEIEGLLEASPSLKNHLQSIYPERLAKAKKNVNKLFPVPQDAHITLEQALNPDFLPEG